MDAELCVINLCQPELHLDTDSLNARLNRVEEQLKSGSFVASAPREEFAMEDEEDLPPIPDDSDAPPEPVETPVQETQMPAGFWPDLAAQVRKELRPPVSGFFAPTPNAPVQGVLVGNVLELCCTNSFTVDVVNKRETLELVSRKASAMLGRTVQVKTVDRSAGPQNSSSMDQLLSFGKAHSDIVRIKNT